MIFWFVSTVGALGCVLTPLRGGLTGFVVGCGLGRSGNIVGSGWVEIFGFFLGLIFGVEILGGDCRAWLGWPDEGVRGYVGVGLGGVLFGMFGEILGGVVGDFADHVVRADMEIDIFRISYGDVQGFEYDVGTFDVYRPFEDGVDHVHEGGLDSFGVFDEGDGVDLGVDPGLHAFDHAGVEVAEIFLLEGGGTAAVSGDLDVGAAANVGMEGHGYIPRKSRFSPKSMIWLGWKRDTRLKYLF